MTLSSDILAIKAKNFKATPKHYGEYSTVYKLGHSDAIKEAALLTKNHEKRVQELEEILKAFVNWATDETGTKSLLDDEELWSRAEKILK